MSLKNKKILVVSSKFPEEYSGSGLRAYNTYKRLEEKYELEWDVVANSISYQGNENYKYKDKDVYRISSPFKVNSENRLFRIVSILFSMLWETLFVLMFLLKNGKKYHLLHTFGNTWSIGIFTLYFSFKKKPIIRELVNDMKNPFYPIQITKSIQKVFKRKNTLFIAISVKLKILLNKFDCNNVWQRPNPINENIFFVDYENKEYLREKLTGFSNDDYIITSVATFLDRKNQLFLVDVLNKLPQQYKLVLAGPVKKEHISYFKLLKEKIEKLDIQDRVEVNNTFIDNVDEYMKMSDVYLFPSKSEGLGTPILEAQACGVPVVSNLLKNITDSEIINGEGGYCSSLDPEEFAQKIEMALEISKEVLIKNAEYIRNRASTEKIDEEYYKYLKKL
jgi:glycosyltransferase involved in cell wall biosynthesis